jgi:hypothetical protein
MKKLKSIEEIKSFFKQNDTPIYYISPNGFNLIGIEKWISNFRFITYEDHFDGQFESFFTPKEVKPKKLFNSIEEITNYLLTHPEVVNFINKNGNSGDNGKVLFLMFDERTEILAKNLGLEIYFPCARMRKYLDSKVNMSMIAERSEVACIPNILSKVNSYKHLKLISSVLGTDLVIQMPYGNSGENTFFISNEHDYEKYASIIENEKVVKIMKKLKCRNAAIEACVTKFGTIRSPIYLELIGNEQLTPYTGGWCSNELLPKRFSKEIRDKIRNYTQNFGDQLFKDGYRGYFELDFMIDEEDDNEVYLGELNPRLTTISNLTNNCDCANRDLPLFLFHLLEWMDVPFEIDLNSLNEKWAEENYNESFSLLNVKHTLDSVEKITDIPSSGVWKMKMDMNICYKTFATKRESFSSENEAFYFNIAKEGDDLYEGVDLGILLLKGNVTSDDHQLSKRAKKWINAIRSQYRSNIVLPFSKTGENAKK